MPTLTSKWFKLTRCLIFLISIVPACNGPAAVEKNLEIKREKFSLSYASGWDLDKADEDYDPDALFSLDHKDGSSSITFIVFDDSIDAKKMIQAQEDELRKNMIKSPEAVTTLSQWGKYTGEGVEIKGKALGVIKYTMSVFVYTDSSRSFIVLEQVEQKNHAKRKKDFELMRNSFQLRETDSRLPTTD